MMEIVASGFILSVLTLLCAEIRNGFVKPAQSLKRSSYKLSNHSQRSTYMYYIF